MRIAFIYQRHLSDELARGIRIALAVARIAPTADLLLLVEGATVMATAWAIGGRALVGSPVRIVDIAPAQPKWRLPMFGDNRRPSLATLIETNERLLRSCDVLVRHQEPSSIIINTKRHHGDGPTHDLVRNITSSGMLVEVVDAAAGVREDLGHYAENATYVSMPIPFRLPADHAARLIFELARVA